MDIATPPSLLDPSSRHCCLLDLNLTLPLALALAIPLALAPGPSLALDIATVYSLLDPKLYLYPCYADKLLLPLLWTKLYMRGTPRLPSSTKEQ